MSSFSARSSSLIRRRMLAKGCPAKCALKKLVASVNCDGVYERSVCRMRFCTSPSAVTRMSSTRRSARRRNSRWRNAASRRRGVMTTPANCVSCDSNPAAVLTSCCGRSAESSPDMRRISLSSTGFVTMRLSTKKRYPFDVGTRPADVCGLVMKPISSRSAITLRTVAADSSSPEWRDSAREPTGWPSLTYRSMSVFRRCWARASNIRSILSSTPCNNARPVGRRDESAPTVPVV